MIRGQAGLNQGEGWIDRLTSKGPLPTRSIYFQAEEPDSSSAAFDEEARLLNVTRCPICQKFVLDLPQHISLSHHQPRPAVAAAAMVLPASAAAAAAINLVKKEDNSGGAPINLSVR